MSTAKKVAVVTGGSRGIGAAVVRKLASDGLEVAVVYHKQSAAADEVVHAVRKMGGKAAAFQADVADEAALQSMMRDVAREFGRIDVLVNAAGIFAGGVIGEIERKTFEEQFMTNTWGVIAATQAALPYLGQRGGAIVNVSSSLVVRPLAGTVIYSASKAAVDSLTLGAAIELGSRGIRVNAVAPALTRTDMTAGIPDEQRSEETRLTPLGRLAEPEDIADVVAFLCSEEARWVTGRTILADGGRM
jgi:3-oxoacyl-[acyl-carrier protein] reductase